MPLLRLQLLVTQLIARVREWRAVLRRDRRDAPAAAAIAYFVLPVASIHRDVTPNGVRVYSLCGSCGARLEASATLCDDCAQRRSRLG